MEGFEHRHDIFFIFDNNKVTELHGCAETRLGVKSGGEELGAAVLVRSRLTVAWTRVESVRLERDGGLGLGVQRQSLQRR